MLLLKDLLEQNFKYMTSVSKTIYINKLDDIVNKYNNTCHNTIRMKPVDIKPNTISIKRITNMILNLKLMIM